MRTLNQPRTKLPTLYGDSFLSSIQENIQVARLMVFWSTPCYAALVAHLILLWTPSNCETGLQSVIIDLHALNFTNYIQNVPADQKMVVEFYASWCPHCRHFKPKYEELGRVLASQTDSTTLPVLATRIDCAAAENSDICGSFKVRSYPTLRLGQPSHFLGKDLNNSVALESREVDGLVKEINSYMQKSISDDSAIQIKSSMLHAPSTTRFNTSRKEENRVASLADIERATVEIFDHMLSNKALLAAKEHRKAFLDFVYLLLSAHPSARCKASMQELWQKRDELWPESQSEPEQKLRSFRVCTNSFVSEEWKTCLGTEDGSRGFTCGVWVLMHSLASRVNEAYGARTWHKGISGFIRYFFGCKVCADHFYEILQRPDALTLQTQKDVTMWLWKVHNEVNQRLNQEEMDQDIVDINFPKVQWPWRDLCTLCYSPEDSEGRIMWNLNEVYIFLSEYYKDPSPTSVTGSRRWQKDTATIGTRLPNSTMLETHMEVQAENLSNHTLSGDDKELEAIEQGSSLSADVGYGPPACVLIVVTVVATLKHRSKANDLYKGIKDK